MSPAQRKRLGEILIEQNRLLPEQLSAALERQRESGDRLGQVLLGMGMLSYEELSAALTEQTGIPHVWLRKGLVDPKVVRIIDHEKAASMNIMPMFKIHNSLTLAMANTDAIFTIDDIEEMTGLKIQPVQCRASDIQAMIKEYYSDSLAMETFIESFAESDIEVVERSYEDLSMVEEQAEGARVINLVNMVLMNSIREGASDIHIEPDKDVCRVRYRIDGILQELMVVRADMHAPVISRVKVMARMDIAERRVPQDGRIHVRAADREVDVRVSSMPTVQGEKIVMRLLDKARLVLDINNIGFEPDDLNQVKTLLRRPNGMLLVTGPTGSGKTTTLYCGLSLISSLEKNVVTIEDPVEYQLEMVNQIQVQEEHKLTFARTLRSVLRQDPDIIMVGEIRDRDTAEVGVQAALTGHLVLSTLHTNDSAGAIARMTEMGIEPYLQCSSIIGVVAQRLMRKVCDDCKTEFLPPADLLRRIRWKGENKSFVTGQGCDKCFDTGLRGRTGIYELLTVNEKMRRAILENPSADNIRKTALENNMQTLADSAFKVVERHETTLEEALRIVYVEDEADEIIAAAEVEPLEA